MNSKPGGQYPAIQSVIPWIGLALLAFLVYLPALSGGFVWDDEALTGNPLLTSLAGLKKIWLAPGQLPREGHYWPLVYSTFWLEYQFVGLRPFLYHLDNVLLHGAAVVLLWRVLRRLGVPGAWLAAALFAVHPVHAESVAWVIERKDVLSGAFYFGAALAFLRCQDMAAGPRRKLEYALALALFGAALLSKSIVVGLPVALAIVLWWRRGRLVREDLLALAPLALMALVVTLADLHFLNSMQFTGAEGSGLTLPERVLMAGRGIWVYLAKLAWPHPLAPFYPKWPPDLAAGLALLACAGLLAGLWLARKRLGRGLFAGAAFFLVMLAPALGLVDFEFLRFSWVADRFQYLASAGPLVLAAAGLTQLGRRLRRPAAARLLGAAALVVLSLLCLRQAAFYHDSPTLFRAAIAAYPRCWPAYTNLAWALRQEGRVADAVALLREGLQRMPAPEYHLLHELAKGLEEERQFQEAERGYRESLRLKPDYLSGRKSFGDFLANRGRTDEAVEQYREVLRLNSNDLVALNNLGNALRSQRKLTEAERAYAKAARLGPQFPEYHSNLALVLLDEGKLPQTLEQCRMALELDPDHVPAHITAGQALLMEGKFPEALAHFMQAREQRPHSPIILFLLGKTCQAMNDTAKAVDYYRETLKTQPDFPEAAERLNALLN